MGIEVISFVASLLHEFSNLLDLKIQIGEDEEYEEIIK
jgi:hypothetical protein